MKKMEWDSGLAAQAQKWANTCPESGPNAHNPNRGGTGENMAFYPS